jgi:hypothetical protein
MLHQSRVILINIYEGYVMAKQRDVHTAALGANSATGNNAKAPQNIELF